MSHSGFFHNLGNSAFLTVVGIILLFSSAIGVTLIAPRYVDKTWTEPTSDYQAQMYEVVDKNVFIGLEKTEGQDLQTIQRLEAGNTLIAFSESEFFRIVCDKSLEKYISKFGSGKTILTSDVLLLRKPEGSCLKMAENLEKELKVQWLASHKGEAEVPIFTIVELYNPQKKEAFVKANANPFFSDWVEKDYQILNPCASYHSSKQGVVYVNNPIEYLVEFKQGLGVSRWEYSESGRPIKNVEELTSKAFGFMSRHDLIYMGETLYAREGCFNCHTDQTRTLIQDLVLNGSETYPAPPSSASEYVYQKITFPGTKRNGPDLSRVGVKRPSRAWHMAHFWSPKTESKGSIMPSFQHLFDNDPRGSGKNPYGIPNFKFEAFYQYLMTKGTRITPPTQAWWLGKDPLRTLDIIEGRKKVEDSHHE